MNGKIIHGAQIRVNYGKAVSVGPSTTPRQPIPPDNDTSSNQTPSIFILPSEMPIARAPAPPPDVRSVIETFVGFVISNNSATQTQSSPSSINPSHAYYKWRIFDLWSQTHPPVPSPPRPQQPPPLMGAPMRMEEQMEFSRLMETITHTHPNKGRHQSCEGLDHRTAPAHLGHCRQASESTRNGCQLFI